MLGFSMVVLGIVRQRFRSVWRPTTSKDWPNGGRNTLSTRDINGINVPAARPCCQRPTEPPELIPRFARLAPAAVSAAPINLSNPCNLGDPSAVYIYTRALRDAALIAGGTAPVRGLGPG